MVRRQLVSLLVSLLVIVVSPGGGATAHAAAEAPSRVMIDQVEVLGVSVISSELVEPEIEVSPGDTLARAKVVRSAQNLQALYKRHGYDEATVRTQLVKRVDAHKRAETVLEFQVTEGQPTRVAEVVFVQEGSRDGTVYYDNWKKLEKGMENRVGLVPGDIFDQEKVGGGTRALIEYLASEEYVGARADDVRASTAEPPLVSATKPLVGGTGRWVKLEIHIRLGDRVSFGFRGNTVFSSGRLLDLVTEQRSQGFGKDYIGAIRSRIEKEYHSMGYAQVKVKPYDFERPEQDERHVTFECTEGPRVMIESLGFEGNSVFSSRSLLDEFKQVASPLVQRDYYVEEDVQKAAEGLVEWMKSKGYLSAKLVTINTSPVAKKRPLQPASVKVAIYVFEGEQTLVQGVTFGGLHVFPPEDVMKILGVQNGMPLNLAAFNEGIEQLKTTYRGKGYLSVGISNEGVAEGAQSVVKYSDDNRAAEIHLELAEGPQYRVSQIQYEGRNQTEEKVISREMELHDGDVVEEPRLAQSEANLRRLGIFSSARVRAVDDPEHPDEKIVKISVEEADPGIIAGGPGFRNDLGIRAFGEAGYTNLWGLNHSVFLDASVNRRLTRADCSPNHGTDIPFCFMEYNAQLAYSWPWFQGIDVTFRPTISISGNEYTNFDATAVELGLNWEKRLLRSPNLTAILTYDLERVNQFNALIDTDNQLLRIGSIIPSLRLDMRDNPLSPTKGLFTQISYEIAQPYFGSQNPTPSEHESPVGYQRLLFRADYTVPVARDISWYFSFRTGYEYSTASDPNDPLKRGEIPLIKQFALGGIGSLRGYDEQELNFRNQAILGTETYVNYRTQIDFPIAGPLRFGPFLDAANLLLDSYSLGNLRYGTGFGFRYMTPFGPINLDYGVALWPRTDYPAGNQFYFSIGVI